jgi:SAM-dependent methyltransferase
VLATWPEFDSEPVDAITFTRSLHHIEDLPRAVQKARDTLKPRGKLLIEDFAFDAVDQRTITWLANVVRGQALVNIGATDFLSHLIAGEDPAVIWRRHHEEHGIHSAEAIHRSIAERFIINDTTPVAYLYRYLIAALPATSDAAVFLQQVVRDELQRGHAGEIELIGRRIVAMPFDE